MLAQAILVQVFLVQAVSAQSYQVHAVVVQSSWMLDIWRGSQERAVSFEAAIKKGGQTKHWRAALQLLREGIQSGTKLSPGPYIATASACRKGGQWQLALLLLSEMWEAKLEPNVIYTTILGALCPNRVLS